MTLIFKNREHPAPQKPVVEHSASTEPSHKKVPQPKWKGGQDIPVDRFIRMKDLIKLTGLSRPTIYRRLKGGRFPQPTKIGAATVWVRGEIQAWMAYQAQKRECT